MRSTTTARWRVLLATCAVLTAAAPAARAETLCHVAGMTIQYTSGGNALDVLLPGAVPDAVAYRDSDGGSRVERWDGRTGRVRWRTEVAFGGLVVAETPRRTQLLGAGLGGACGELDVVRLDAATGRAARPTRLAAVATYDRPDSDVHVLPPGDFDGDGWYDLAALRSAQPRTAPVPFVSCQNQWPGHCQQPANGPRYSRLDVVSGRTGAVLLARELGVAKAAFPNAVWVRRDGADALLLSRPVDPVSTEVLLLGRRGVAWRTTVAAGPEDTPLYPAPGGAVVGAVAGETNLGTATMRLTYVDARTGAPGWTGVLAGDQVVRPDGGGNLVAFDPAAMLTRKISGRDGGTLWQRGPEPVLATRPAFVGDVDGRGAGDLTVLRPDGWAVYSGETGATLMTLPAAEWPVGVGDVTGDGADDLVGVTDAGNGTDVVARLVAGGSYATRWRSTVPLGRSGQGLMATGRGDTVLLYLRGDPAVALDARTGRLRWLVREET